MYMGYTWVCGWVVYVGSSQNIMAVKLVYEAGVKLLC